MWIRTVVNLISMSRQYYQTRLISEFKYIKQLKCIRYFCLEVGAMIMQWVLLLFAKYRNGMVHSIKIKPLTNRSTMFQTHKRFNLTWLSRNRHYKEAAHKKVRCSRWKSLRKDRHLTRNMKKINKEEEVERTQRIVRAQKKDQGVRKRILQKTDTGQARNNLIKLTWTTSTILKKFKLVNKCILAMLTTQIWWLSKARIRMNLSHQSRSFKLL